MNKYLFASLLFFVLISCKKEKAPEESDESDESKITKTINVTFDLPGNSTYQPNDLSVSSIFTLNKPVENSNSSIESFNENSLELAIAFNQHGHPTLMSYYNPGNQDSFEMSLESTAIALTLFHPWTFDLSLEAKIEAMNHIKTLPEYNSLISELENSLENGNPTPLEVPQIHNAIIDLQTTTFDKISVEIDPLKIESSGDLIGVDNINSSNSYAFAVYDQSGQIIDDEKLIPHIQKLNLSWQDFVSNIFSNSSEVHVPELVKLPSDGQYELRIKSGLSFDSSEENLAAAWDNTKILTGNLLGLFSEALEEKFENFDCYISVGEFIYNSGTSSFNISQSLNEFNSGSINSYELVLRVLEVIKEQNDQINDLIKNCDSGNILDQIEETAIESFLSTLLNITAKTQSAFNSTNHLTEWLANPKEFNKCVELSNGTIESCPLIWTTLPYATPDQQGFCDAFMYWGWSGGTAPYQVTIDGVAQVSNFPNSGGPYQPGQMCAGDTKVMIVTDDNGEQISHTFVIP